MCRFLMLSILRKVWLLVKGERWDNRVGPTGKGGIFGEQW